MRKRGVVGVRQAWSVIVEAVDELELDLARVETGEGGRLSGLSRPENVPGCEIADGGREKMLNPLWEVVALGVSGRWIVIEGEREGGV